jgi:hypothetical protein
MVEIAKRTQLDHVSNAAHDQQADADGLAETKKLGAVGCTNQLATKTRLRCEHRQGRRTLGAAAHELDARLGEVGRHLDELLDLVGHCDGVFFW